MAIRRRKEVSAYLLEVLEQLGVDETAGALVEGSVDGDDVALGNQLDEVLNTASLDSLGGVCGEAGEMT